MKLFPAFHTTWGIRGLQIPPVKTIAVGIAYSITFLSNRAFHLWSCQSFTEAMNDGWVHARVNDLAEDCEVWSRDTDTRGVKFLDLASSYVKITVLHYLFISTSASKRGCTTKLFTMNSCDIRHVCLTVPAVFPFPNAK